jgi:hypothetical protein
MSSKRLILTWGFALTAFAMTSSAVEKSKGDMIEEAKTQLYGNMSDQLQAVQILASQDPKDIVTYDIIDLLNKILKDGGNPRLLKAVVTGFGQIADRAEGGTKGDVRKILDGVMRDGNQHAVVRAEAIDALKPITDAKSYEGQQTVEYLTKLAEDKSTESSIVRACWSFLGDKGKGIPDRLIKAIFSTDPNQRRPAISAYISIIIRTKANVDGSTATAIINAVEDEKANEDLRVDLLGLMGIAMKTGSKFMNAGDTLTGIIKKSQKLKVKLTAVTVVGVTLDSDLMKILAGVYDDNKDKTEAEAVALRRAACSSAGEFFGPFGNKDISQYKTDLTKLSEMCVVALTSDKDGAVCKEAAYALGNMYSKRYDRRRPVAALIEALGDKDTTVVDTAYDSLKFITGEDFGKELEAWREWYKKNDGKLKPAG